MNVCIVCVQVCVCVCVCVCVHVRMCVCGRAHTSSTVNSLSAVVLILEDLVFCVDRQQSKQRMVTFVCTHCYNLILCISVYLSSHLVAQTKYYIGVYCM